MKIQVFNFNTQAVRVIKDENGEPWFVAKDVADVLGIVNHRDAVGDLDEDEKKLVSVKSTLGQAKRMQVISESGLYSMIFASRKPEAAPFKRWVRKDVLPDIRKHGYYALANYLTDQPQTWNKTYPDKYFQQVLKLYGYEFQKGINPPQFVGAFTNEYVYKALDKQLPAELKKRKQDCETLDEQKAMMHQFLTQDGKGALEKHLDKLVTLMEASSTISQFRLLWEKVFVSPNQMELYLR